ncbi:DUF445 family protein [Salmonella enterica]|nr:DUF445 family protein [Salmonella enterica]EAY8675000.1 DUF445 family protein [Salmonella enterica]EBB7874809.1 DUF445 family protein [Salmonella enterica]
MNKIAELKRAKRLALSLLLIAAATFVTTLFLPPSFWVLGVKAIAEAAMVGALADWFAVVALFRRIPIPFISRHTAIIPRNKDRIGENLGQFVQEKFLDTQSLIALIRRHEPALLIGNWFSQPDNASRVGQHLLQIMSGFLELTDDRYLGEIWADLRQWLKTDINAEDSKVKQRIAHAGQWFGETLIADDALRASLNGHLEQAAHRVAPEFAAFLTRHISDTVKGWDARDMSQQIELNIGKDLQFIRVNGTLVGGAIGLVLYLLSQIPALLSI